MKPPIPAPSAAARNPPIEETAETTMIGRKYLRGF